MKKHRHIYLALILSLILGVHEGKIALWSGSGGDPIRVFPYRADTLPPAARAALEEGIPIDDPEALEEMAENYLS